LKLKKKCIGLKSSISNDLVFKRRSFIFSFPNIIRMIKSRRMRWAMYVAHTGGKKSAFRVLVGNSEEERPLRGPRRMWEDKIRWILKRWTEFEQSGSMKCWEILEWLTT
jgi:hypothetical protein